MSSINAVYAPSLQKHIQKVFLNAPKKRCMHCEAAQNGTQQCIIITKEQEWEVEAEAGMKWDEEKMKQEHREAFATVRGKGI